MQKSDISGLNVVGQVKTTQVTFKDDDVQEDGEVEVEQKVVEDEEHHDEEESNAAGRVLGQGVYCLF